MKGKLTPKKSRDWPYSRLRPSRPTPSKSLRLAGLPSEDRRRHLLGRTALVVVVLILVVVASVAIVVNYVDSQFGCFGCGGVHFNPCAQAGNSLSVKCSGLDVTLEGPSCNTRTGICTVTLSNNGTAPDYNIYTTECNVLVVIDRNATSYTVIPVEGINGGPAAGVLAGGMESTATCAVPTNRFMTNGTATEACFTITNVANQTRSAPLCWFDGTWSDSSVSIAQLDCPALLSNIGVTFFTLNATMGRVNANVSNANSYGVWVARANGTSTVTPLGIAVSGPSVGEWFAIPQNETVPAKSIAALNFLGTPNSGLQTSYTLSFLPVNETITYTQPCSMTYEGT